MFQSNFLFMYTMYNQKYTHNSNFLVIGHLEPNSPIVQQYNSIDFPRAVIKTHYGEKTFQFFFIKFFNNFGKKDFFANYELFISNINRNLNCIFRNFIKIFPISDIFYKNLDYLDKKNKYKQNN